jgi:hypothetical protein
MRTSHTSRFPFMGSFHDAERVYVHFVFLSPADLIFPRFHGGVKRLKFRSQPNITNITLRVIYSCRGVFLTLLNITFGFLKAATWNHVQYWITYWILITESPQQIYFGIFILFNSLTLVVILSSGTRGVKLVLQIDVHASCN